MAIYHCSVRTISRADNHSAVAAAAYRSGSALQDERTGQSHNYRNRKGIVDAFILLPPHAPEAYADRLTLWNAAESAEKRNNSRVAREVILALPHELSEEQRLALTKDMALFLVSKYGVAVDAAVHAPQEARGDDPRNHHAHLLFLTRVVEQNGLGEKTRILDDKEQGPQQIELIRQVWETLANAALQQAGFDNLRIDRRTLEDQGIDRIPQEHVGKAGTHGDTPADDDEEPRTKDEEEDGGENDTGKAGSDDKSLTPSTSKKEPSSSSKEKLAIVQLKAETRLGLNEEIKQLNQQRAAFSPVSLKEQIKELDRLVDRLDVRVKRLKTLSDKTALPSRITNAILVLYHRSVEAVAARTRDKDAREQIAALREARTVRQQERYGKVYRAHVSERMAEMRKNIQILESKQKQHQRYAAFVCLIERHVELIQPTLQTPPISMKSEWRTVTSSQERQAKIITESNMVAARIPIEYKPIIQQEPLYRSFTAVSKGEERPVANYRTYTMGPKATKPEENTRTEKSFSIAATPQKDNADRAIWHKEVIVKIKSLDQIRAEHAPIILKEPMDSAKVWKIEVNDKGKGILERMQADIRTRKPAEPKLNQEGFSGKFNYPTKTVTNQESIQKVIREAKLACAKVPVEFRVNFYSQNDASSKLESILSGGWESSLNMKGAMPERTMSSKFNQAAESNKGKSILDAPDPKLEQ